MFCKNESGKIGDESLTSGDPENPSHKDCQREKSKAVFTTEYVNRSSLSLLSLRRKKSKKENNASFVILLLGFYQFFAGTTMILLTLGAYPCCSFFTNFSFLNKDKVSLYSFSEKIPRKIP